MSLFISSLNSGSNGNCYYIGNELDAVLIDAGLSCRETERRMLRNHLEMKKVKALFISHEHSDHTRGTQVIARKYQIPVYFSEGTYTHCRLQVDPHLLRFFNPSAAVQVGELEVKAFPKFHDAIDPHSFIVSGNGITIGVLTDIGSVCEHVISHFGKCHAAFLEANYDEIMLEKGRYPVYLKNRIRGDHGHLSNDQALALFNRYRPENMSHLLLSHLSQDNNNPHLVERLFKSHSGGTHIAIASRHRESPVYCIDEGMYKTQQNQVSVPSANYIQSKLF